MKKVTTMVLMLCFILSGALCYANGEARTENEKGEGIPIEIKESGSCTGPSRGNSIISTLSLSSDIGNKLGSTNKYPIQFCTKNVTRLYVDTTGYVGINTTLPRQMLHVVDGNILISRTSTRADGSTNGSILFGNEVTTQVPYGKWGIEYLNQYIGNKLCQGLNFWRTSQNNGLLNFALFLADNGNVGIGTSQPQATLSVNGEVLAKSVRVNTSTSYWPDYVFEEDYELMGLRELEAYIRVHEHLPGVPSAIDIEQKGDVDLGKLNAILLEKVEELTLYIIELQKQIEELKRQNGGKVVRP